jgi:hypothetical protein
MYKKSMTIGKWLLVFIFAAASGYAQGIVTLQNRSIPIYQGDGSYTLYNARISYGLGGPVESGSNVTSEAFSAGGKTWGLYARAALYGGPAGVSEDQMVLLPPIVNFRTGFNAGFVNVGRDLSRTIDGVPGAAKAWLQVRAWDTADESLSYEAAALKSGQGIYLGKSMIVQVTPSGTGGTPSTPPDLVDERTGLPLQPFSLTFIPEPSQVLIGFLGLLLLLRRKPANNIS